MYILRERDVELAGWDRKWGSGYLHFVRDFTWDAIVCPYIGADVAFVHRLYINSLNTKH